MELRHLRYFVAVAEELHFGRAAARLHIAQPPLSQQIRQLEADLGVRLFERTRRRVALTHAGAVYLAEVRRLLAELDAAGERALLAQQGEVGLLALGFVGTASYAVLPGILRAYRARYPGVEVTLHELNSAEQQAALERGQIDAGLVRLAGRSPSLAHEVLRREPFVVALPDGHPLAAAPALALADLAGERFVLHPRGGSAGFYEQIVAACRQQGFTPTVVQEATEMLTLVGLVAAGLGISLVPASVAQLHTAGVVYRPLRDAALTAELVLIWRAEDRSPLVEAFRAVAQDTAGASSPATAPIEV